MAYWDELSSATGSPTGSAIVEDPFARAVRIYQMELANAEATAQARRNPAPNFGMDELTGTPFQLPQQDASMPGPATGRRAFGDTEADIQREVLAPFEQFGDALMEPFQRGGRRGNRAALDKSPGDSWSGPINLGGGRIAQFSKTGERRIVNEGSLPNGKIAAPKMSEVDKHKLASAERSISRAKTSLAKFATLPESSRAKLGASEAAEIAAGQAVVDEILGRYSAPATPPASAPVFEPRPRLGSTQFFSSPQDEADNFVPNGLPVARGGPPQPVPDSASSPVPRRMVWDSKQRKLVPAK